MATQASHTHNHSHEDGHAHSHSHDHDAQALQQQQHGHAHEILDGPGSYVSREMPLTSGRDWAERGFTVGIGG